MSVYHARHDTETTTSRSFDNDAWRERRPDLDAFSAPGSAGIVGAQRYTLILFLPTTFYLFTTQLCNKATERPFVFLSFCVAILLTFALFHNGSLVQGEYHYFFGYYPMAGPLHPIHVIQSMLIAVRSSYIAYRKMTRTTGTEHGKIRLCFIGLLIYCFAVIDYLSNE